MNRNKNFDEVNKSKILLVFNKYSKKNIILDNLNDFQLGELVGSFAGDGNSYHENYKNISRYTNRYYLSYIDDKPYVLYLEELLKSINLKTNTYIKKYNDQPSVIELRFYSKDFYSLMKLFLSWEKQKRYTVHLNDDLYGYSKDFLRGFLRGLMDTDGFVEISGVAFGVVSKQLVLDYQNILKIFNINSKLTVKKRTGNRRNLYLCRIRRKELDDYNRFIGFSNLRKLKSLLKIINGAARI